MGFASTSSQTIAAVAGVTPATMYHHFVNKRQLYVAAFQHSVDIAWRGYGEAATATGTSFLDELVAVVDAAVRVMQRRPAMTMLAIRGGDRSRSRRSRSHHPGWGDGGDGGACRGAGRAAPDDVVYVRPVVEMMLWGVSVIGRGDTNMQERCAEAIDLILHGRLVQRPTRRRRTG